MFGRIYSIFKSRNREFMRDRASFTWNLLLPIVLMLGLSFAFNEDRNAYTVGVLQDGAEIVTEQHPFLSTRYIRFVPTSDKDDALRKLSRHQLDLLVEFDAAPRYWVNPDSAKGHFVELALLQSSSTAPPTIEKEQILGEAVRYVDWVLPGILGMNMMFSSLFGVGYVIVRYRKNGFLKRLRATPLTAFEFITAQVTSRMVLIMCYHHVRLRGDTPLSRYSHGGQLFHAVPRCAGWRHIAGITRPGGLGAGYQRRTGRRSPESDQLADDAVVRCLVFAGGCREFCAEPCKDLPADTHIELRSRRHARRRHTC